MRSILSVKNANGNEHDVTAVVGWQTKLRQAMYDAISDEDIKEIVRSQVAAAKKGDKAALRFVMDYLIGAKQQVTLQQRNYYRVEDAARSELRRNGREHG